MATQTTEEAAAPRRSVTGASRLKSILGGSAGNLVEWYDWYAYSAFTLYFAPTIFPSQSRTAQLLSAAMIFAVGFLMRPIGAWHGRLGLLVGELDWEEA